MLIYFFYSVLLIKELCRAEILTDLSKKKLDIMKLNKLNKVTAIFPKSVFPVQHRKYVYQHRIPHIQISLCTKFYLNKQIWIFDPKLFGIEYFQSKLDKVNIAVKFNISELNSLPNFSLYR